MLTIFQQSDSPSLIPFRTGEEAWFWTMAALLARRDGAGTGWRPPGAARPCEPDDVIKCLDTLYRRRAITLSHARVLRAWGERQAAPCRSEPSQANDFQVWQQAMGQLEWALRGRGIVR